MTVVDIANLTLTLCGAEGTLINIDDACKEGRLCSKHYDSARRAVLAKHPWKFAIKRIKVDQDTVETPAFGFTYRYQVPEDFIRSISVNDMYEEFVREGRYILANASGPINLRYVSDEQSVELFDPLFADAVAADLASRIVYALSQSNERDTAIKQAYRETIARARFADSFDQSIQRVQANDFTDARLSSTTWAAPFQGPPIGG